MVTLGDTITPVKARPAFLIGVGIAVIMFGAAIVTPADADLWGHLKFGGDTVADHQIVQTDRYSFTSDRPWINHEWLAEVSFVEAYHVGGSTGLIVFKLAIIGLLLAAIAWRLKRAGSPLRLGAIILLLAFVGTFWRTHTIRPQLFSVLFFATLLIVLVEADAGRRRGLFLVPPLFGLWVNLHGGWIVGAAVLGVWAAVRCLHARTSPSDRVLFALVGVAAIAATLLNPYGLGLWTFLAETVRFERTGIQDWSSILTSPAALGIPWTLMLVAAGLAIWRSGWPRRVDYIVIVAVLAVASFRVSRLDAFFALAVVILLAPQLVNAWPHARHPATSMTRVGPGPGVIGITAVTLAAILVPASFVMRPYLGCLTIGGNWQPPEADAGHFIALNRLTGRMLTWYDWGEYAIWHFGPDLQVSMDGRRETVYSAATIQAHRSFYAAGDSAFLFLGRLNPDYIWLPRGLPIVNRLRGAGWLPIFESQASSILARTRAGPYQQPTRLPTAMRCFPGP